MKTELNSLLFLCVIDLLYILMDEPEASLLYSTICMQEPDTVIPDSIISEDERRADGADIQKRPGERIYVQRRQHFRHHDGTLQVRVAELRCPILQMSMCVITDNSHQQTFSCRQHHGAAETKKQQN